MFSKKLEEEFNLQMMYEFHSGYIYLSMASYFLSRNLDGFANFFFVHELEERKHAFKFLKFLNERNAKIIIPAIEKPQETFKSAEDAAKIALEHEKFVTKRINDLMDLAIKENDHAAASFLKWFVDEQIEEEVLFSDLLIKIQMAGDNPGAIFMLDAKLAERKAE